MLLLQKISNDILSSCNFLCNFPRIVEFTASLSMLKCENQENIEVLNKSQNVSQLERMGTRFQRQGSGAFDITESGHVGIFSSRFGPYICDSWAL